MPPAHQCQRLWNCPLSCRPAFYFFSEDQREERNIHMKMVIKTDAAPQAIAVQGGRFLFLSGQIPLDPASGEIVAGGIEEQTARILKNLEAVLIAAGSSLGQVTKTTVFLKNMDDFPKMNGVYGKYFVDSPPARSTVEVSRLPRDVAVEIDAIAVVG
jgi:2-iminobutanoate/2-iminopropanoate deaminase